MDREFIFIEKEKNKWFYLLENEDAPKFAWNWIDYAKVYGSFNSLNDAKRHFLNSCDEEFSEEVIITNDHYLKLSPDKRDYYNILIDQIL